MGTLPDGDFPDVEALLPQTVAVLKERQTGGKKVKETFYAQGVAELVLLLERKDKTDMEQVKKFTGFTENAYRYFFAYEEHFPDVTPELQVILPSGKRENAPKKLEPKKEAAIIAYTYSQKMTDRKAAEVLQSQGSPFVFQKNGDPYVMQTWSNKFNAKLKEEYTLHKYPSNPDPEHFKEEALKDFKCVALKLFRQPEHENPPLWLGNRKSENKLPMYEGTGSQLMALLRLRQDVREQLRVLKILEPDGFLCEYKCEKGEDGIKPFHMDLALSYALYTKQGWETMACVKSLAQFNWEAERYLPEEEIPFAAAGDAGVISFPLDMEWVSGPAYLWTWRAAAVLWSGAVLLVGLSCLFAGADWWENELPTDFLQHVTNTCIALVIVSVIAFGLYADRQAMSYCIVPWLQNVEETMIIPFYGQAGCDLFQRFSLACTLSQMLTIQLNAWFLGNTIRNNDCQIESAWKWLWKQSAFGFCPLNLLHSVVLLWGLSALQMLVPALYTLARLSTAPTDIRSSVELNIPIDRQSYKRKCGSLLSGSLTEGVTMMALAAGMRYTGAVSLSYPLAMIKRIKTEQMGFRTRNTPEEGPEVWEQTEHGWQFRCVKELLKLYSVQSKRVWFILVFKYACQMNVQVTLFIIKGAMHNKVFNYFAALGELVSIAAMLLGIASELFDLINLVRTFWDVRSSVCECLDKQQEQQKAAEKGMNVGNEHPHARHFFMDANEITEETLTFADLRSEYYRALANTVSVLLVVVFAMWLIGYQMMKLLSFWTCPDRLWSFRHGCLALDDLNDFLQGPHGVCQEMQ